MSDIKKKYRDNKLKSGASEVIPKYAKALKLLKAREGSFDKITEKINSVIVEVCAKETIDTEEDLLHTNYIEAADSRLLAFPIYQRTKNDVLPMTFYNGEKFPIVPFGNNQVSDKYKSLVGTDVTSKLSTMGAFNSIFSNITSNMIELGSVSKAMSQKFSNFERISVDFRTKSLGDVGKITLSGSNLKDYLGGFFGESDNYKTFDARFDFGLENYKVEFTNDNVPINIIKAYKICGEGESFIKFGLTTNNFSDEDYMEIYQYDAEGGNEDIAITFTPIFNGKTVTSSVKLENNDFIVENGRSTIGDRYTDVEYYEPKDYNPEDTSQSLGDHWATITYPKSELSSEEIDAYLEPSNSPNLVTKQKLIEYQALIDDVIDILTIYDSLNGKYLLSTTENSDGIGSIEKIEDDPKYIKMRVNFTNDETYNHIQKQNITLTVERPNCNDLQFVELPIAQRISDPLILAELFQIFQVKSNGRDIRNTMLGDNQIVFFSKDLNFDLLGITNSDIREAYKNSFENEIFSVNRFYDELFPKGGDLQDKQKATLEGTNYFMNYEVVGSHKVGKLWWKKTVDDWGYVKRPRACKKKEDVYIKSATGTLIFTPTKPEPVKVKLYNFDATTKNMVPYMHSVEFTGDENSRSGTFNISYTEDGSSSSYEIPVNALLTFVEHYDKNLKLCFSGYEKPIKSLSLYDIIIGDIYSESDINKKYYFKRIEAEYPILETPLNDITLEDQSTNVNGELKNKFYLTSKTGKYIPKTITTENNLLKNLITLENSVYEDDSKTE